MSIDNGGVGLVGGGEVSTVMQIGEGNTAMWGGLVSLPKTFLISLPGNKILSLK